MDQFLVARQLRYENPPINPESFDELPIPTASFTTDSFDWFGDEEYDYPAVARDHLGSLDVEVKSPHPHPHVQFWDGDRVWEEAISEDETLTRQRRQVASGNRRGHHVPVSALKEVELEDEEEDEEEKVIVKRRTIPTAHESHQLKVNQRKEAQDARNGSRNQDKQPKHLTFEHGTNNGNANGNRSRSSQDTPQRNHLTVDYNTGDNRNQDTDNQVQFTNVTKSKNGAKTVSNGGQEFQVALQHTQQNGITIGNGHDHESVPKKSEIIIPLNPKEVEATKLLITAQIKEAIQQDSSNNTNGKEVTDSARVGPDGKPISSRPSPSTQSTDATNGTKSKEHQSSHVKRRDTLSTGEEASSDDSNRSVASVEVLEEEQQSDVSEPVVKMVKKKQNEVILRTEFDDVLEELGKYNPQKKIQAKDSKQTQAKDAKETQAKDVKETQPKDPNETQAKDPLETQTKDLKETQAKDLKETQAKETQAKDPKEVQGGSKNPAPVELLKKLTDKMSTLKTAQLSRSLKPHLAVITQYLDTKEGRHHLNALVQQLNPRRLVYVPDLSPLVQKLLELDQTKMLLKLRDGFSTLHVSNGLLTVVEDGDHEMRSTAMDMYSYFLLDSTRGDEFDFEEGVRVALHSLLSPIQAVRHSALECLTVLAPYFKTPIKYYKSMAPDRVVDAVDVRLKRKLLPKIKNGKLEYGLKDKDIDTTSQDVDIAWIVKGDLRRRRSTLRKKSLALTLAAVKSEDGELFLEPIFNNERRHKDKGKPKGKKSRGNSSDEEAEESTDVKKKQRASGQQSESHLKVLMTEDIQTPRAKSERSDRSESSQRVREREVERVEPRNQKQQYKDEWNHEVPERRVSEPKHRDRDRDENIQQGKQHMNGGGGSAENGRSSRATKVTLERGSSTDSDFIRRPVRATTIKKPIKVYVEDVDNDDDDDDRDDAPLTRSRASEKVHSPRKKGSGNSKSMSPQRKKQQQEQKPPSSASLTLLTLSQLSSSNWECVFEGFATLNKLLQVPIYKQDLHLIILSITNHVANLRSQVARAAIQSCSNLVQKFGERLEHDSNIIADKLLDRTSDTNKFIRSDAQNGLQFIIATSSVERCMNILEQGVQHRNGLVRATVGRLTLQFIHRIGVGVALGEYSNRLLPMLVKLLQDGSQEARAAARLALLPLATSNYFESCLKRHVPYERLRMVSKFMTSIKAEAQKQNQRGF